MTGLQTLPTDSTAAARPGPGTHPVRRVVLVLLAWVRLVWVDPVRDGRLRLRGGAPGLGALAVISSVGIVAGLVVIGTSRWLRQVLPVEISASGLGAPSQLQWVLIALLVLALALVQTSALHSPWWTRTLALLVSLVYLGSLGALTSTPATQSQHALIVAGAWVVLLVLTVLRIRGRFAWWEFVTVLTVLVTATATTTYFSLAQRQVLRPGAYVDFTWLMLVNVGYLSAPLIMAAGYAIAEVAYTTIVWGVDLARAHLHRRVMIIGLTLVLGWRLYAEIAGWLDTKLLSSTRILWAVGVLVVALLLGVLMDRLADRRWRRDGITSAAEVASDLHRLLLPVAVLTLSGLLIQVALVPVASYLATVATAAGRPGVAGVMDSIGATLDHAAAWTAQWWVQAIITIGLLALGVWRATRGDRGLAELLGMVALLRAVDQVHGLEVSTYYLPFVITLVAVGLVGAWAISRDLTIRRVEALAVVVLLAAAFGSRELFADPLAVVLGGSAAVLFGLAWGFLTGAGDAHRDTPRFPRPTRTLFFLGNTLLGVSVVAFTALTNNTFGSLDPEAVTARGDRLFGGALLLGAMVSVVLTAVRDREVGPPT